MFGDCHIHVAMDGVNFKEAMARHAGGPDDAHIRSVLAAYRDKGISFLRDGGDAYSVSKRAKELAPEYGIDYRSPLFAIHRKGFYGGIVGRGYETLDEYAALVQQASDEGADFIKIMTTGIMDFHEYGRIVGGEGLPADEVRSMVQIAHDAGLAVMSHTNGARAVLDAIDAGVDSIEHGNYMDDECIQALVECDVCYVPTACVVYNLFEDPSFEQDVLERIFDQSCASIAAACEEGALIAIGSDGGAVGTPHARGTYDEYDCFCIAMPDRVLRDGAIRIGQTYLERIFQRQGDDEAGM